MMGLLRIRTPFPFYPLWAILLAGAVVLGPVASLAGEEDGDGRVEISGDLKAWHKVTLTIMGPFAQETDESPNPFTDYRFAVTFRHESGMPEYTVPGYFAADGRAAETSAESGNRWRVHLSPGKPGRWNYQIEFVQGEEAALNDRAETTPVAGCHGKRGSFHVEPSNKSGRDLRGRGRLQYVGRRYLRFAESGEYFLKAGADAPETLLAYADFDGTERSRPQQRRRGEADPVPGLHRYEPHVQDWRPGDPTWKDGKGKGLIGAVNYLAESGCNVFSFLTYNAGGDGDNVWPFVRRQEKRHYDCSKLDQWQIVFDHAQTRGMYLHFKLQETEMDDTRHRRGREVTEALDGGDLGPERKLYLRELIARYGYLLALNWNLGEENTQSTKQQREMAAYIAAVDPYDHHIVVHTFPNQQDKVYRPLLGDGSVLTGTSLQNSDVRDCHWQTIKWVRASRDAGQPWIIAFDEPGNAQFGVPPDPDYPGMEGRYDEPNPRLPTIHDVRKYVLWGNLLAGGAGVEYYFGYQLPQNDLLCEDFRSRKRSWGYCRIALDFFREHEIPFVEMSSADELVGNAENDNSRYCFAKPGEIYLVYLPTGGTVELDLTGAAGRFTVAWFNPREGGELQKGTVTEVGGDAAVSLGMPPEQQDDDCLAVIRVRR